MSGGEVGDTRVFLVEDHAVVRRMLSKVIARTDGLVLCGQAETAEEALAHLPGCQADLALVDISLPQMDGIELIGILHERYPSLLTLAVSGHDESLYALPALRAGARGYVMKGKIARVVEAIHHVCNGGLYASDAVRARLDQHL